VLAAIMPGRYKSGAAQGCKRARISLTNPSGTVTGITLDEPGIGYVNAPDIIIYKPDGTVHTASPPITVAVPSAATLDGARARAMRAPGGDAARPAPCTRQHAPPPLQPPRPPCARPRPGATA
jgi:hypothetical protein